MPTPTTPAIPTSSGRGRATRYGRTLAGGLLLLLALAVGAEGTAAWQPPLAALAALLGLMALHPSYQPPATGLRAALPFAAMVGILALSADPALRVWQPPAAWADLVRLSHLGALFSIGLLLGGAAWTLARHRRLPNWRSALGFLAVPYLLGAFFLLAAPQLLTDLGRTLSLGLATAPTVQLVLGRLAVLLVLNELIVVGIGWRMDRRWSRDYRLHLVLVASAVFAALGPQIASLATTPTVAGLGWLPRVAAVTLLGAAAMAGLWGQTFLLTGVLLDAIHLRRPTYQVGAVHWQGGCAKGAVYSGIFILLVQLIAAAVQEPMLRAAWAQLPLATAAFAGALLYPLARTILESFDGSQPFFLRLTRNATERTGYARGAVAGFAVGLALVMGLPELGSYQRFLFGFLAGALAYAGVDLVKDGWFIVRGPRQRLQTWRYYALGAVLGGIVGGAIAWYADAAQVAVVVAKFQAYAAVHYPSAGRAVERYVIYPLFSKWGSTDLGAVEGGVRLLYSESLSGVINWSLAAPLFSVNLVFLTALFQRSLQPIRALVSERGLVAVIEQGIRVLRWGLWMAPVIYSFLRMAPDPTWYNQDGAVRTMVATVQSWSLAPGDFRAWSLEVFLGLLAYDWFRVLIWFDHMGLRVATLVNLSFVGGDRLDEGAARALGYTGRAHAIPEAIRRFGTWAPLLIPFYIPRGAEWDRVWGEAERIAGGGFSLLPAVETVLIAYGVAAVGAAIFTLVFWLRDKPTRVPSAAPPAAPRDEPRYAPHHVFHIGNGVYTLETSADGRCYGRTLRVGRSEGEIDLTRRSDERMQLCGKFVYLRDMSHGAGPLWSLGWQPMRHAGHDYGIARLSPTRLRFVNSRAGLRAEAVVDVAEADTLEHWRIRIENDTDEEKLIELTTYQEFALAGWDGYRRTPAYNAIHIGTCFVQSLGAVIARNRHLKPRSADGYQFAHEVAFHAAAGIEAAHVKLVGYQDARPCFIGTGTLAEPEGLLHGRFRSPEDEGLLYGFDPIASLQLRIKVPAGGSAEFSIVDGYARDEQEAARLISTWLNLPRPDPAKLDALFERRRRVDNSLRRDQGAPAPFHFSPDGTELVLTGTTPRPWTHVLANALGHGAVVSNEGEIFSFAGNAQQNGLTPCYLDTVPSQVPAQLVYLHDLDTGDIDTPTFIPHRRPDATHEVVYGRGYAVFKKRTEALDMQLTAFVAADEPVELRLLTLRNRLGRTMRLRVVSYLEMTLGETPRDSIDRLSIHGGTPGSLFFANPSNQFQGGWAFVATSLESTGQETVRRRFLGDTAHDWRNPHFVLHGEGDPTQHDDGRRVASFAATIELEPGATVSFSLALGQVADLEEAAAMAETYRSLEVAERALATTRRYWAERLNRLRVETDRPAFDRLVNDWLPYQVAAARLWGRTGPNQRGGAFGFRDQLQDVLPLLFTEPEAARRQILLHARQQFVEGDVLQWWHRSRTGQTGLGARNRASDPHLWLPYLVARYVEATGDHGILDAELPFLEGRRIPRRVEGLVHVPRPSRDEAPLYEHCRRAIAFTLERLGPNGLPLMGTGDWNDGLSDVGKRGRGESVWLGFFLYDVLTSFAPLADVHEGGEAGGRYREQAAALRERLQAMWRGDRFVRAVTDDGVELAWHDALVGSWPIISGAVGLQQGLETLEGALAGLERADQVLVLTPPFDEDSPVVAGKIADYPPGVRENGGQYSHGSSWLVDAAMRLAQEAQAHGNGAMAARLHDRAFELWCKISPLGKTAPDKLDRYGLSPQQQPADIYFGPGYELYGGWSWYTGAAARMLTAAYAMLGLRMSKGELTVAPEALSRAGGLRLVRVVHRGRVLAEAQAPKVPAK